MGDLLKKQYETFIDGLVFGSASNLKGPASLSWSLMIKLMSEYGLDSSDAMILNFATSTKDFRGFLTSDADYRYAKNYKERFDIVVPQSCLKNKVDRSWKT